jgi:hypothetical protein
MTEKPLTSEKLRKYFKNPFDLCNHSILIAQARIAGGKSALLVEVLDIVELEGAAGELNKE